MSRKPAQSKKASKSSSGVSKALVVSGPQFGEPIATPDPTKFTVKHTSDKEAYSILDHERGEIPPIPFPKAGGKAEPILQLAKALGEKGDEIVQRIAAAKQIVLHALGDTGNIRGATAENSVTDKLVSDFENEASQSTPSFAYILGDVVYSFGEDKYYYDQFYDPYRDYPAPIFAIAGNHDGMVAPNTNTPSLKAFLENFCTAGQPPHRTSETGNLVRTAGIQPGVYFTLEAPFVRIIGLYSNALEDPGIISTQKDLGKSLGTKAKIKTYPNLSDVQIDFLEAALKRAKVDEEAALKANQKPSAVIIAVHHPPYVAIDPAKAQTAGRHGNSPEMLADIDRLCTELEFWPHAVLSGHAHNYQRFTRYYDKRETPYVVSGNGGHAHTALTKKGMPTLRTPSLEPELSNGSDRVVFESYDDKNFGYLRIIATELQLRIEYHPASDGASTKTPDDSVTVDLRNRVLVHYQPSFETSAAPVAAAGLVSVEAAVAVAAIKGIDTSAITTGKGKQIKAKGYDAVGVYLRSDRCTTAMIKDLQQAGLRIWSTYETGHPDHDNYFTKSQGTADGKAAAAFAAKIAQPAGTQIYATVDYDPDDDDASGPTINGRISDYMAAFQAEVKAKGYLASVYGSGRTCRILIGKGLSETGWLCESSSFAEHEEFKPRASIVQVSEINKDWDSDTIADATKPGLW
jgi:Domain of unknown function (DUF1906)/Calcineurin-like phosphoesterase